MKFTDLSSAEFYQDPYPLYQRIRDDGRLVPIAANTFITGHHDIIEALLLDRKMGRRYLDSIRVRYGEEGIHEPVFQTMSRMFLMMNPPEHTRLRALLMKAFNARQIDLLREVTQAVADELIDALPADRPFDLVSSFTVPMPVRIICRLMDVRIDDASMLGADVGELMQSLEAAPLSADRLASANAAARKLEAYFKDVVAARRRKPGTDLISTLLSVNDDGDTFSEDEIISNVILLFFAGHETTSNMIGNALISLHRHPDQLDKLRAHPELLPRAVSECMRHDSSVQFVARTALEETEVDGVTLPKGTTVFMLLGAANRDPARFENPDKLDIERSESTNRSIMFGGGIHYCLGARLATLELETALGTLLTRLPNLRLTNIDDLQWHPRNTLRGVTSLIATR
ncbi:cytochrome P450 [Paraburkholderia sediminicola]|uniref:Cytochrome P450 n=1 Tax=Paraburkholderia rhynchosiae TaxID=487049 RepID=A0ACC7NDN5_9BURK